jgi:hypothetical protein
MYSPKRNPKQIREMTVTVRCQRLVDAALAYRDAWRARKAFAKQFRQEPRTDQVFLKATVAQLDRNLTDSRLNLERIAISLRNDPFATKKIEKENRTWKGNRK